MMNNLLNALLLLSLVLLLPTTASLGLMLPKARISRPHCYRCGEKQKLGPSSSPVYLYSNTAQDFPLFDQSESFSIRNYKHKRWNLAYLYKAPSPGNESKPPMILIHPVGIGLSSWFWGKVMKEYDGRDGGNPAIYAVDLIGCGLEHGSDKWDPQEDGLFFPLSWVEGVETFIQSVVLPEYRLEKKDPKNVNGCVVVVQGGVASVGVLLSARNPTSFVSRLILTSPPTYEDMIKPVPKDELQRNYNFLTSKIWGGLAFTLLEKRPLIKLFSNLFLFKEECDEIWLDETMNGASYVEARTPVQAFNAGLLNHRSFEKEILELEQPVLVVCGTGDKRNEDRQKYATQMKQCTIQVIDGLNVLPYENPRETVDVIEKFSMM